MRSTCLRSHSKPVGIPHRSVLSIVGPSGIGKTALSRKVLSELKRQNNIIPVYISFGKAYSRSSDAVLDLLEQIKEETVDEEKFSRNF